MTDTLSRNARSRLMSRIHQPTLLEKRVHTWLGAKHIRHTMYPKVIGRPDIMVRPLAPPAVQRYIYVFVDGCFFHACPKHYRRPKTRAAYWKRHIEDANRRRERARAALPYRYMRIWEHEVRDGTFKHRVVQALRMGVGPMDMKGF